jgi:hypothetical protein
VTRSSILRAGELREGTAAVTVEATRHRAGEWFDRPATADHPITFIILWIRFAPRSLR